MTGGPPLIEGSPGHARTDRLASTIHMQKTRPMRGRVAAVFLWVLPAALTALPLVLDSSFGQGGRVLTSFPGVVAGRALAIQPDGRIVLVGQSGDQLQPDATLARYLSNGDLDPAFGSGGRVVTTFDPERTGAFAVVPQTDGKLVIAGGGGSEGLFLVARYLADGTLDPAFGSGGAVTTDMTTGTDLATSLVIQPDGRILAGGTSVAAIYGQSDLALARYLPDGSLDASFGAGGRLEVDVDGTEDRLTAMALQPDGRIVACASAFYPSHLGVAAILRLNSDGSLDPTFGTGGKVLTQAVGCSAVKLQSDGKLVVFGGVSVPPPVYETFTAARFLPDGSFDASFGQGGIVVTLLPGRQGFEVDGAILGDGRLIAVASSQVLNAQANGDGVLFGYGPDGAPDATVGPNGWKVFDFGGIDTPVSLAVQADGKIVVGGTSGPYAGPFQFLVARFGSPSALTTVPALSGLGTILLGIGLAAIGVASLHVRRGS